jgi:hypothetical protein
MSARRTLLILLIALGFCLPGLFCLGADQPAEEPAEKANPLLGAWRQVDGAELVRFTPRRVTICSKGRRRFYGVAYGDGQVILTHELATTRVGVALKDGVLSLTRRSGTREYRRLEQVPDELKLKRFPLGEAGEVPADTMKEIKTELTKRIKLDQAVRTDPARYHEMPRVDAANTAYLKEVVRTYGWIDVDRFGAKASNQAFLIVQHSGSIPLMLAALPEIKKDVKAKKIDGQPYALLYDRLSLALGGKQRYGSQIGTNKNGESVVLPLEDRENVDKLRAGIGIMSLSTYLKLYEQATGESVKFLDDE